jgi:integrase
VDETGGLYRLRHTFASEALAAGVPPFDVAKMMGTSLQMLDRHYGHLVAGYEERIRSLLDRQAAGHVVATPAPPAQHLLGEGAAVQAVP